MKESEHFREHYEYQNLALIYMKEFERSNQNFKVINGMTQDIINFFEFF